MLHVIHAATCVKLVGETPVGGLLGHVLRISAPVIEYFEVVFPTQQCPVSQVANKAIRGAYLDIGCPP